jgi:N-acetylglutamate synthase-like GNAT family acetyltransferase
MTLPIHSLAAHRMTITLRRATEQDQPAIRSLVHSERLNPCGLDWRNFLVATDASSLVGAVQLRKYRDGSRELGSLVVRAEVRGQGIASRLIDALLTPEDGRVQMITAAAFAARYARFGFRRIAAGAAPAAVRRNYRMGRLAGFISLFIGRRPRRLVILERSGSPTRYRLPCPSPVYAT